MQHAEYGFEEAVQLPELVALPNDRMRAFVWQYAHNGQNITLAALEAGYSKSWAHANSWQLMRRDDVTAALGALAKQMVKEGAFIGLQGAIVVARDPTHKNHLKACFGLMDRGGLGPQAELHVRHEKVLTAEDRLNMAKAISEKTGVPLAKILGPNRIPPQLEATKVADDNWDF